MRVKAMTLATAAVLASLSFPASAAAAGTIVLPLSDAALVTVHENAAEPPTMTFGADGRTQLLGLSWTNWSKPVATAQGTWREDVGPAGEPQYVEAPITLSATRIERCDGNLTYTQLSYVSPDPEVGVYPTDLRGLWHRCTAPTNRAVGGRRAAMCHAGHPVGDGEYSDGAITWVKAISCRQALGLVAPRYKRIQSQSQRSRFRIGKFACVYKPAGPVTAKVCRRGDQAFGFL